MPKDFEEVDEFKLKLEETLDEYFPKIEEEGPEKVANRRGAALVLFSEAVLLARKLVEKAHQEGRDELLKELSITKDFQTPEFRRLRKIWEKAEREKVIGEVIEVNFVCGCGTGHKLTVRNGNIIGDIIALQEPKDERMKKLTIGSFKREGSQGSFGHYFSHILPDGKEVCLESCLEGYCVGIYDKKGGDLIGEKTCTKIEGMLESQIASGFSILSGEALEKAVKIANEKIKLLKPR